MRCCLTCSSAAAGWRWCRASRAGRATPGSSAYAASKFAVTGLAESIYYELADRGVSVTCIQPGFVESDIRRIDNRGVLHKNAKDPVPAWIVVRADKAARSIVRYIYRRKFDAVITAHGKVLVWLARHFSWLHALHASHRDARQDTFASESSTDGLMEIWRWNENLAQDHAQDVGGGRHDWRSRRRKRSSLRRPVRTARKASICFRIGAPLWQNEARFNELLALSIRIAGVTDEITLFTSETHPPLPLDVILERMPVMKARMEAARARGLPVAASTSWRRSATTRRTCPTACRATSRR